MTDLMMQGPFFANPGYFNIMQPSQYKRCTFLQCKTMETDGFSRKCTVRQSKRTCTTKTALELKLVKQFDA